MAFVAEQTADRASDLADTTIGHQIRTRHVGTLVGREEERRAGNLLSPQRGTQGVPSASSSVGAVSSRSAMSSS